MKIPAHFRFEGTAEWSSVASQLLELHADPSPISETSWLEIIRWLGGTIFDERSYLAGECAALLIKDRAPDSVREMAISLSEQNDWIVHFKNIILSGTEDPRRQRWIEVARQSNSSAVCNFALGLQQTLYNRIEVG